MIWRFLQSPSAGIIVATEILKVIRIRRYEGKMLSPEGEPDGIPVASF